MVSPPVVNCAREGGDTEDGFTLEQQQEFQ